MTWQTVSPDTPAEVAGQDGKRYPAKRPTIVAAKNEREAERAQEALIVAPGRVYICRHQRPTIVAAEVTTSVVPIGTTPTSAATIRRNGL